MTTLRKSVDTAVLFLLYLLGSVFIALGELARKPVSMALGHPPRPVVRQEDLTHVIQNAFLFIALSAVVGSWIVRHW